MEPEGIVLAFDTASERVAIGVGARTGVRVQTVRTRDFDAPRAAMSGVLPAVSELLSDTSLSPCDISQVVVGRGPGSFTGVRIGVASAKGLAHGLGVPLFGVGTLDAIAWGVPEDWSGTLAVVGDAMRGEVYPALFDITGVRAVRSVIRRSADYVAHPEHAAREWSSLDEPMLLAGNGLAKHADVFTEAFDERASLAPESWWAPTGDGLLRAFAASLADGSVVGGDPGLVLPVYTRLSDAEEAERVRAGLDPVAPPSTGVSGPPAGDANAHGSPEPSGAAS